MREVIQEELRHIKQTYADPRRTQIVEAGATARAALTTADLVQEQAVWVTITQSGRVSRIPGNKPPKFGDEIPLALLSANTRDLLYLLTLKGRAATIPVHSIPEKDDPADGAPWASISALDSQARVVTAVAVSGEMVKAAEAAKASEAGESQSSGLTSCYLSMGTANGVVKRISAADLPGPTAQVFNVMNVADDDSLVSARLTNGVEEILLVTSQGRAIRFKEEEVRAMGLNAAGVMGIKPGEPGDRVIGMDVAQPKADVFLITDAGMGKRTPLKDFPTQGRYGVGVTAADLAGKQRLVGMAVGAADDKVVVITSKDTAKLLKFDVAARRGRPARGSGIVTLKVGETVVRLTSLLERFVVPEPKLSPAKKTPSKTKRK
jgi:DNA gyrase subunit A